MGGCEVTHCFFLILLINPFFDYHCIKKECKMEDIGDIIYLSLLIAFILFGGFGKKSKKKKRQQSKATIPSNTQKNREKKLKDIVSSQPQPKSQTATSHKQVRWDRSATKPLSKIPGDLFETVYSPKNEQSTNEILSYDTVDDVSKLRVKKRIRESVLKKQSSFKSIEMLEKTDTSFEPINIELDNVQDARKAFIYSEIFNRKYS